MQKGYISNVETKNSNLKLLASELPLPVTLIVNTIYIHSITPMTPISALINKY
jgi:hypothetical protein